MTQYACLWSIVDNTCAMKAGTTDSIRKTQISFSALNKIWHSTAYSTQTELRIFITKVRAVLRYGCETWKNSKCMTTKLQVFINKCLRKILRIFRPDQITNEELCSAPSNVEQIYRSGNTSEDDWAIRCKNRRQASPRVEPPR